MSTREYHSASAGYYNAAFVEADADQEWVVSAKQDEPSFLPCAIMEPDSVIRIAPMVRKGGWDDIHFHPHLRLPMECSVGQGMVVTLEAMAHECVAVALSPDHSFQLGKTYVVHFGASGNVSTVIRRRLPSGTEAVDVSLPSRVCLERSWVPYWVCLTSTGKLYAGTGKHVGQGCIGMLDDGLYHQLRSGVDAVRFVGLGNSAVGRNTRPLKVRKVCVTTVPSYLPDVLAALPIDSLPLVNVEHHEEDGDDDEMQVLMEEYQKECQKNKARAAKFGIPYKEPPPQAFLQWSQARKLRANPAQGFITGMDILSPEEQAKQEARKARFASSNAEDGTNKRATPEGEEEEGDAAMIVEEEEKEPLPVQQAWDNEALVRQHRKDPPESLWVNPPPLEERREDADAFGMGTSEEALLVPEKVHICSTDWAAFKQIRTDDVKAYFKDYGPSYVEWLGELSCNVLFEDKFSAARSLHHMSQAIPTPPPAEELMTETGGDENGQEKGSENETENVDAAPAAPDFGKMGWRFGLQPIRKMTNDRFGRKGTTARLLMRLATTKDVLVERPTSWPAPPPGFSVKRVLGPGSDFDTNPRKKKRRRRGPRNASDQQTGEHPDLGRGLQAGRDGFSVEELEAERARKREAAEGDEGDVAASIAGTMDETEK